MTKQKIIEHLENQLKVRLKRLSTMDKRHKIPKRLNDEIVELKEMIHYMNGKRTLINRPPNGG